MFGFFGGGSTENEAASDSKGPPPPPPLDENGAGHPLLDSNNAPTSKASPKTRFRSLVKKQQHATTLGNMMRELRDPKLSPFVLEMEEEETPDDVKRVSYDSNSHLSVLLQMHGSVWGDVLPYCLVNVLITYLVWFGKQNGYDLTCPLSGHNFMAILVSFLIVTRSQITYARFMEARGYLADIFRSCRELMHFTAVLTMQDSSRGAKQWRQDVAYRTILLLRVTIAALDYKSSQINTWDVMPDNTRDQLELYVGEETHGVNSPLMKWAHGARTLSDENFRAPIVLAYNLRAEIMKQRNGDYLLREMHVNEELKILGFVSEYISAFHGLKKLITTPFPFPLVQMARTFLFFWIFTLPFALVGNFHDPVDVMLIVFFTTYGFVGLEYVSMELDDPFGDDPNDFDDLGMAQMVFEDIYITLYKLDGSKSAEELRAKVSARVRKGNALTNYRCDLSRELSDPIPENVSA